MPPRSLPSHPLVDADILQCRRRPRGGHTPRGHPVILTDDDASDGTGPLDVPGLLGKHALPPLQQGDAALHNVPVGQLSAAAVGLSHCHKAPDLERGRGSESGTDKRQRERRTGRQTERSGSVPRIEEDSLGVH